MPTPFQHLIYAKAVLEDPALPPAIRCRLEEAKEAFFLGNTAVDAQTITGQPRVKTHFYHLPPAKDSRAGEVMLSTYPELRDPHRLPLEQAAFISGYLVHLAWDEFWAWDVYMPLYMESRLWPDRLAGNVHHNALRVMLDRQAEIQLRGWREIAPLLCASEPDGWLPFMEGSVLFRWRDWLVAQLEDPAKVETTRVFAERMGVSVGHLEEVVQAVERDVYHPLQHKLRASMRRFESHGRRDSRDVLAQYWRLEGEANLAGVVESKEPGEWDAQISTPIRARMAVTTQVGRTFYA